MGRTSVPCRDSRMVSKMQMAALLGLTLQRCTWYKAQAHEQGHSTYLHQERAANKMCVCQEIWYSALRESLQKVKKIILIQAMCKDPWWCYVRSCARPSRCTMHNTNRDHRNLCKKQSYPPRKLPALDYSRVKARSASLRRSTSLSLAADQCGSQLRGVFHHAREVWRV